MKNSDRANICAVVLVGSFVFAACANNDGVGKSPAGMSGSNAGTGGASGGSGGGSGSGGTTSGTGSGGATGTGGAAGAAGTGNDGGTTTCSGTSTLPKGDSNRTINVGGTSRTYILHVPASYTGTTAVPLILDFHGLGSSGSGQKSSSGMSALSDQDGFIIAWPNGIDNAWNIGPCCTVSRTVDDLGFAKGMVAEISAAGCIDAKRVYANGMSMGGGISHYLACNAADVFAAVTPSAFDLLEENEEPCHPSRPISVLSFRGTSDNVVPYAGGASNPPNGCCPAIHFLGAEGTLTKWAQLSSCTGSATTSGNTQMYTQCGGAMQVGLYTIQGGGHSPGPAATAWDFLKTKSLP